MACTRRLNEGIGGGGEQTRLLPIAMHIFHVKGHVRHVHRI